VCDAEEVNVDSNGKGRMKKTTKQSSVILKYVNLNLIQWRNEL
jgi:hypothetical protein